MKPSVWVLVIGFGLMALTVSLISFAAVCVVALAAEMFFD